MIPLQLTLKNFLSYRDASLDFRGLHTACICGSNGAGKSSLLEAITWVIWGKSRTTSDDVINAGEKNVRVNFTFICNNDTYRAIRSRQRGRSTSLEFQIETESGEFRSLTAKGVNETQKQIISHLKLDYTTFINSAYLRQGRADEFMLRGASERKQILAELLNLNRYEMLATKAKDAAKQFKGQAEQLDLSLQPLQERLEKRKDLVLERDSVMAELGQLQQVQETQKKELQGLEAIARERQTWEQQLTWQQSQKDGLQRDCDRLVRERDGLERQLATLQQHLSQEAEIKAGYQQWVQLQQQEEAFAGKFQADREAREQKQHLEQQLNQQINEINLQIRQLQTRFEALEQQEAELVEMLSQGEKVAGALAQLHHHRQHLQKLDELQLQVSPLLQRRADLKVELERVQARLSARLEQLNASESDWSTQLTQVPQLRQQVLSVNSQVVELEKKQVYSQRVRDKQQERGNFQERLQENQRTYQKQLGELHRKLEMLQEQEAVCPLCDRPLDEHHRDRVIQKTQTEQEQAEQQLWVIREQMATCERELQVLRAEYSQLSQELQPYDSLLQEQGQLEARLESTFDVQERLQAIQTEKKVLEGQLSAGNYAIELHSELQALEQELQRLNYDEQTHALVRGEVKNWRWAEVKQARLEDARRKQEKLNAQKPELQGKIKELQQQIQALQDNSPLQQQIRAAEESIQALGYDRARHETLLSALRQAQAWQLRDRELEQAKQQFPQVQEKFKELEGRLQEKLEQQKLVEGRCRDLTEQMAQIADNRPEIEALERQISQRRRQLDELLASQGRIEQQFKQLDEKKAEYKETEEKLQQVRRQCRVYLELAQAFGKNGIQALMIENVLPQLEAETNQILARLTGNQLHVQFLTQRAGKSSRSKKKATKLIDTLEILIADARGTRPYETYSGGEAFRINFAIRLALARLLAQRAGTSMQMLIVDEGFGTQDAEGCDRLIAAINAIASDFSCILTVTHMPQFKEAFQNRIEVRKTEGGSRLQLLT